MGLTRKSSKKVVKNTERSGSNAYLGTLRSEFDEPETTPSGFIHLQENVGIQRCSDLNGGEWTVGATSGSWYRRQGSDTPWMRVPSPSQAVGNPLPGAWQREIKLPERNEVSGKSLGVLDATEMLGEKTSNSGATTVKMAENYVDADLENAMKVGPRGENFSALEPLEYEDVKESQGPVGGAFSGIEDYFVPPSEK
jgi:hypothetical protein